jgi:hypothetical protein
MSRDYQGTMPKWPLSHRIEADRTFHSLELSSIFQLFFIRYLTIYRINHLAASREGDKEMYLCITKHASGDETAVEENLLCKV